MENFRGNLTSFQSIRTTISNPRPSSTLSGSPETGIIKYKAKIWPLKSYIILLQTIKHTLKAGVSNMRPAPDAFVRPANILANDKSIKFD